MVVPPKILGEYTMSPSAKEMPSKEQTLAVGSKLPGKGRFLSNIKDSTKLITGFLVVTVIGSLVGAVGLFFSDRPFILKSYAQTSARRPQ